jgi:hypothetical protein
MDPLGIDKAASEITAEGIPELLQGLNQAVDRIERLLDRLDGATITIRLAREKK